MQEVLLRCPSMAAHPHLITAGVTQLLINSEHMLVANVMLFDQVCASSLPALAGDLTGEVMAHLSDFQFRKLILQPDYVKRNDLYVARRCSYASNRPLTMHNRMYSTRSQSDIRHS